MNLGELFTEAQLAEVNRILKAHEDSVERVRALKEYLSQFRTELEAKGAVPEYLAYVFEYIALKQRFREWREQNAHLN